MQMGIKNKRLSVGDLVSLRRSNGPIMHYMGIVIRVNPNLRFVTVRWFIDWRVSSHCRVRDLKLVSKAS